MIEAEEEPLELLFFDTFSHDITEKLNLDLVQFPKPVYIQELRIIPLGARVQADFPGGVRLGATNPSQFKVELFVNDLGKPGASTFECLGDFEYNQNNCIHLECKQGEEFYRKIPTDGLVLKGYYTTITLAVYGTFTKNITGPIISPPEIIPPINQGPVPAPIPVVDPIETVVPNQEWPIEPIAPVSTIETTEIYAGNDYPENYENREYEYYDTDVPKDPRPYANASKRAGNDWNQDDDVKIITIDCDVTEKRSRKKSISSDRQFSYETSRSRGRSQGYSRSPSMCHEYSSKRDWSRSPEYRSRRKRSNSYERGRRGSSYDREKEDHRRRPRSPTDSPRRPRSPDHQMSSGGSDDDITIPCGHISKFEKLQPIRVIDRSIEDRLKNSPASTTGTPLESPAGGIEDDTMSVGEQFEPILSDEDIADDFDLGELDYEFNENEEQKTFNPFNATLEKFTFSEEEATLSIIDYQIVKLRDLLKKLMGNPRYSIKGTANFVNESADYKEGFVDYTEQVVHILNQLYNLECHEKINEIFTGFVDAKWEGLENLINCIKIGLDMSLAMTQAQPGYKLRHMKSGIRLTEFLCCYEDFFKLISEQKLNVFDQLLALYSQKYMALSIKLMIIKSIYSVLDSKLAIENFLNGDYNGYQVMINLIKENPSTRISFAIKSLLKKINLYENLDLIHSSTIDFCLKKEIASDNVEIMEDCFKELIKACSWDEISYTQPKRFLPVSAKFEITKDCSFSFVSAFKIHNLLESIVLLLGLKSNIPPSLHGLILDFLSVLLKKYQKIEYFVDNIEATNALVKILMRKEEEEEIIIEELSRSQSVGVEIAYKVQTAYFLTAIPNLKGDVDKLVENLQNFVHMANGPGKKIVVETICMESNLIPLLNIIDTEKKLNKEGSPGLKCKNPVLSYTVDLVDCAVRHCDDVGFLEQHGKSLLNLVKQHELFEPSVGAMLQEMGVYLKPLEVHEIFHYEDINPLIEIMKRSLEYITTFPGDLIMSLRIIKCLGISEYDDVPNLNHVELKYKYMILQFYSADGVSLILSILDKLNTYFDQPGIHSASLVSSQGVLLTQILLPCVQILRKMITYVIQCRNTEFKDMTAIEHLLKTYALMHSFPPCSIAVSEARKVQDEIIKILLTYTQPTPPTGIDTDHIHKSLWSKMIKEIIKFILFGPYYFIPGLLVFSELLPLPLPVPSKEVLTEVEANKLITERQLWSAHLHPQSNLITEMIQSICTSSYPQVLIILSRVCLQLSDLAPNMTLLVSKAITDLIVNEPLLPGEIASSQHARLYNFLSSLVCHASIKVSVLSVLPGLIELMATILGTANQSPAHVQTQENIYIIFQNMLDSEISMMTGNYTASPELLLACALPPKNIVATIVGVVVDNIASDEVPINVYISAIRTMLLIAEHDITTVTLIAAIEKKRDAIETVFQKLVTKFKELPDLYRPLLVLLFEFIRSLFIIDEPDIVGLNLPNKSFKLSSIQFGYLLKWGTPIIKSENEDEAPADPKPDHFLLRLTELLKDDENPDGFAENVKLAYDHIKDAEVEVGAENILNYNNISLDLLPQAEGIVTQYASRAVYVIGDEFGDQLKANYWLNFSPCEDEIDMEQIPCDLQELAKSSLSTETNLTSDCKRLLHLSASPQSTRDRITTAPCFRTRRVEVEPTTGRPEKKLFATPIRGRGFSRAPITRGDLFRSRPPNTSRPPSLHVDDFLALETCGAQPTGPTGYNKLSREIITIRGNRGGRGRGFSDRGRMSVPAGAQSTGHWQPSPSPSNWSQSHDPNANPNGQHFQHHYREQQSHFGAPPTRARANRGFSRYGARLYPR